MLSKRKEVYNEDIFSIIDKFNVRLDEIGNKLSGDRIIDNGLFLMSFAMFEDTVRSLLKVILYSYPEKLNSKSCHISRQQICDIADHGHKVIIDSELYQLFRGGTKVQLEYLISLISGIEIQRFDNETKEIISKCVEISLYRNSIIHNGSKVSSDVHSNCRYYKTTHLGDLVLSVDRIKFFFNDYFILFNSLKGYAQDKFKFYNDISRVEKLKKLWDRCFNSPIMIFDNYWEIDVANDLIINYKEPECENNISSGEAVYLSFWKNQFNNGIYRIDNFMLCSVHNEIIVDILTVLDETKFYYMIQEAEYIAKEKTTS